MFLNPRRGLALGGGGARGGAHLGVFRVLNEIGYRADVIVGTSIGGLIGALVGAGWSQSRLEQYLTTTNFDDMLPVDRTGNALLTLDVFEEELYRLFGKADLRDLSPLVAVMVADLNQGQRVVLTQGPVVRALTATLAAPGLFPAVACDDYLLVDGGINDNLPTHAAYLLKADRVVAVDLGRNPEAGLGFSSGPSFSRYLERAFYWLLDLSRRQNAFDTSVRANMLTHDTLVEYQLAVCPPDVLIRPDMPGIGLLSMDRIQEAILLGEQSAREQIGELKRLNSVLFVPRKRNLDRLPPLVIDSAC